MNPTPADPSVRPSYTRSRSHTTPSKSTTGTEESGKGIRPPTAGRSSSYISPKPQESHTLPADAHKASRFHASGALQNHRHLPSAQKQSSKHRHTQSELHKPSKRENPESLTHITASIAAERARHDAERVRHSSDLWVARTSNELRRVNTPRTYLGNIAAGDLYRNDIKNTLVYRPISDHRKSSETAKSPIQIALDRASAKKMTRLAAATQADVDRMASRAQDAESELRNRLTEIGKISTELTRRLDYTYYSLLEKLGNLLSTIQSFQDLSAQTRGLMDTFTQNTESLENDMKRKMNQFRNGFDVREAKVADLERRGTRASQRAVDLSKRLENARIIVENWEQREADAIRKRGRMWRGTWMTIISVLAIIGVLIAWNDWSVRGDAVQAGLDIPPGGHANESLRLGEDVAVARTSSLPDDVKTVLRDIEARRMAQSSSAWAALPLSTPTLTPKEEDKRLRAFDEL